MAAGILLLLLLLLLPLRVRGRIAPLHLMVLLPSRVWVVQQVRAGRRRDERTRILGNTVGIEQGQARIHRIRRRSPRRHACFNGFTHPTHPSMDQGRMGNESTTTLTTPPHSTTPQQKRDMRHPKLERLREVAVVERGGVWQGCQVCNPIGTPRSSGMI
jgi:hypothetical protein